MSVWGAAFETWLKNKVGLPHACGYELTHRFTRQETQCGPVERSSFFCNNAKEEVGRGSFLCVSSSPGSRPVKCLRKSHELHTCLIKINKLVKYWRRHGQSSSGLLFEHWAYLLAQLQPRLLCDWLSNSEPMRTSQRVASLKYEKLISIDFSFTASPADFLFLTLYSLLVQLIPESSVSVKPDLQVVFHGLKQSEKISKYHIISVLLNKSHMMYELVFLSSQTNLSPATSALINHAVHTG